MRIIITGGSGLIGRNLASNLSDSYEVVVLSRNPDQQRAKLPSSVKLVAWDGKSAEGWGELADGAHAIVNLAGAGIADKRWSEKRKQEIVSSREQAGQAVLEAVTQAKNKPSLVMQASASGYYGDRGAEVLTERSTQGSDFPAQLCGSWEQSTQAVQEMGVRHVVIRTGIVFSMAGGALPKLVKPFELYVGGRLGDGSQWVPWIHIEDHVAAMRYLLEDEDAQGVYNLVSPTPVTNRTVTQKIGIVMDRPGIFSAPGFILKFALGDMSEILLGGQRVLPERLDKQGFPFRYSDVETALRDLLK